MRWNFDLDTPPGLRFAMKLVAAIIIVAAVLSVAGCMTDRELLRQKADAYLEGWRDAAKQQGHKL